MNASTDTLTPGARPSRRDLLRRAGTVAAGTAAAAVAGSTTLAATSSPAAADTGDHLVLGVANTASTTTHVSYLGATLMADFSGGVFVVADGPGGGSIYSSAIHGLGGYMTSFGVVGESGSNGIAGVFGVGSGPATVGVLAHGERAAMWLDPHGTAPAARADLHGTGELIEDLAGNLWICVVGGQPGYWRKLAGPATAGALHVLAIPKRIYDSRPGLAPLNGKKGRLNNETRVIDAKNNGSGVPAGVTAVAVNLTVTNTNSGGFVAVYRNGIAYPGTSSINWGVANSSLANSAVVAVDAEAQFAAYCPVDTDLVVDITGYYL